VEELELRIDSLAAGGDGVGRDASGRVVFVPGTAPGDRVRVRIEKARARFARAQLQELLEPGPSRVEPRCSVFGRCGGCAWQHVDYPTQLEAKRRILSDALRRIGGIRELPLSHFAGSPQPYAYRLRARLHVEGGRVGYRQRASQALCAIDACPVLLPELEARLGELASRPPDRDGEWELAAAGGEVRAAPLGDEASFAAPLALEVAGERLHFSTGVFAQANALLLETLVRRVCEALGSGGQLVELFAGSGLFTLPLSRRFGSVVAVEGHAAAARDLEANLAAAGRANVRVLSKRVEDAGPGLSGIAPDALLLDPPRVGLPAGGLGLIGELAPQRLAYLSCDPATLARDLRGLQERGYGLVRVEGFDLFPQTPHVEALAVMERV